MRRWSRKAKRRGAAHDDGLALSKGIAARTAREALETAAERARRAEVRAFVFTRERGECRCCRDFYGRRRAAQTMHEIRARGAGGEVSEDNSIAVCGSGTTLCHGELQANRIRVEKLTPAGANGPLRFYRGSKWAA